MSRIIESVVHPVGLGWLVLVFVGLVAIAKKRHGTAAPSLIAALSLFLFGSTPLPAYLLASLEEPFLQATVMEAPANADAIVMLGGVASYCSYEPAGANFGAQVDRFLAAIQCIRSGKATNLVLCGGMPRGSEAPDSEGLLLKPLAESLLPAHVRIYTLPPSGSTREEALKVKLLAQEKGWNQLILVTSAWHMRRALGVFRSLGLRPIPVACDFEGHSGLYRPRERKLLNPIPSPLTLTSFQLYLHESLGWWYYRLRGWIASE